MAVKRALYDKDGVLKSHGFTEFTPGPGETVRVVPENYSEEPGKVRWTGQQEVPHVTGQPIVDDREKDEATKAAEEAKKQRQIDLNIFRSRADQIMSNSEIPQAVRDAFGQLKKLVE